MDKLTHERLIELFEYNSESGQFIRKIRVSRAHAGMIAGTVSKSQGYVEIRIDSQLYLAHRLAFFYMEGRWPKDQVDHINQLKTDNRWGNLREVNGSENNKNRPISTANTSGVMGVSWAKKDNAWQAKIKSERKTYRLGQFKDLFSAVCARKSAELSFKFHENHGGYRP